MASIDKKILFILAKSVLAVFAVSNPETSLKIMLILTGNYIIKQKFLRKYFQLHFKMGNVGIHIFIAAYFKSQFFVKA